MLWFNKILNACQDSRAGLFYPFILKVVKIKKLDLFIIIRIEEKNCFFSWKLNLKKTVEV